MFVTWVACLMSRGAVRPYASSSRCQSAEFVNRNRPGCALSTTALLSDFVNGCGTAEKCVTAVREKREKFKPQNHEMAHEATEETRKLLHWIISFCFISFCFSLFFHFASSFCFGVAGSLRKYSTGLNSRHPKLLLIKQSASLNSKIISLHYFRRDCVCNAAPVNDRKATDRLAYIFLRSTLQFVSSVSVLML